MTNLFQTSAPSRLHSGGVSRFKIECDALTRDDCLTVANWVVEGLSPFSSVEAVKSTGPISRWLAQGFLPHAGNEGPVLICDDVLTTGNSMEKQRDGREAIGVVIFARGQCLEWVRAFLALDSKLT